MEIQPEFFTLREKFLIRYYSSRMKIYLVTILITVCSLAVTYAGNFSQSSGVAEWKAASSEYRMTFCEIVAEKSQSKNPGITGKVIFDSVQEYYNTTDPQLLKTSIYDVVLSTIAMYGAGN
jgi:hypothetical protein